MNNSMYSLSGKRVVVLGGSNGIGLAIAQAVAAEGGAVVIVSSNAQRIEEARKTLPLTTEGLAVDLSVEANIRRLFDTLGAFDHLVYCAGEGIKLGYLADTDIAEARGFLGVRFWGAMAAAKYGAPHIRAGGSIVLTGGNAGKRPGKGRALAASICGAMEGLVRALAVELAPIRVNLVTPGIVKTDLWNGMPPADREQLFADTAARIPVQYVAIARDVAQTYLYLMKQPYSTGASIMVDGGEVLV